jgi:iron-sulfur cluster assembly accessory protein
VKQLIQAQNLENVYLRMGVKGGGCSGMSYSLEFDNEIGPHDKKFEIDGVPVVCDAKSYLYLNGTTLDYVTEGTDGRLHVRQSQREIELWLWHVVLRVGLDGSAASSGAIGRRTGPPGPVLILWRG